MLGTIAVRMMSIVCLGLAKKFFNRSSFKESFVVMCVSWCVQLRSTVMCTPRYGKGSSGLRTVRNCAAWPCTKTLLASWWCAKSATVVLPRRVLFHRYGRLFALNDEVSPICVLGNFHGLKPGVWVGARETDKVVRKSPAASAVFGFVVGRACIPCCLHEANEAAAPCG